MGTRLRSFGERARASLFLVPMLWVVAGAALGVAGLAVDEQVDEEADLALAVTSTPESAREVLSTVAAATMTVAGIAFSVALLVFQQSSSQYSPRVIHGLFRDRFNKGVLGLVVGVFTYCLVVLRSVHGEIEGGPEASVPTVSASIAVVLGIISVLAIVAFLDHNAHRLDVSQILQGVSDDTKRRIRRLWDDDPGDAAHNQLPPDEPTSPGTPVPAGRDGWAQLVQSRDLLDALPPGGVARVEVAPGQYAVEGAPLCSVWPPPDDLEHFTKIVNQAIVLGDSRTLLQDPSYGLRQLVDVALKALSPSTNDPTTAQDAIFHVAAVLHEMLRTSGPDRHVVGPEGRRVLIPKAATPEDLVGLAFDELRPVAGPFPSVYGYLLEAIRLAGSGLEDKGLATAPARHALLRQARLVVAGAERADLAPWDLDRVRTNYEERFGARSPAPSGS